MHKKKVRNIECPAQATLEVLGGKWKGLILFHLRNESKRFNQLKNLIPGVTQRMLAKQLKELESDEIVTRKAYMEIPPKLEYSLTAFGSTLTPILEALHGWGVNYINDINRIRNNSEFQENAVEPEVEA
jgi:DNA-binding HxlR family transcriptional regulator